jgi:hypothetical protein
VNTPDPTALAAALDATPALKLVASASSSNSPHAGRLIVRAPEGTVFPACGDWIDQGQSGLVETIDFVPREGAPLAVIVDGDVAPASGWVPAREFRGAHESLTLGWAAPGTRLRAGCGYKCRSERHVEVLPGELRPVPDVEVAPRGAGSPLSQSLADQLRAAGLVK